MSEANEEGALQGSDRVCNGAATNPALTTTSKDEERDFSSSSWFMEGMLKARSTTALILTGIFSFALKGREFRSADGERSFEGEVVGINSGTVSIKRFADEQVFESPISAFSSEDQNYLRSIHPGKFIERVTLRAETVATESQYFDLHSGDLQRSVTIVNGTTDLLDQTLVFDIRPWVIVPNYENFRMAGKVVRVEALTTAGEARTRIVCFFLWGTQDYVEIADAQYRDVLLDLRTPDTYFVFEPVPSYYGYVACAINLDSGKVMAIRGSKRSAEKFVEQHLAKVLNSDESSVK